MALDVYRLLDALVAVEYLTDSVQGRLTTIPAGSLVRVLETDSGDGRFVEIAWGGRKYSVFPVDLEAHGETVR